MATIIITDLSPIKETTKGGLLCTDKEGTEIELRFQSREGKNRFALIVIELQLPIPAVDVDETSRP